MDKDIKFSDNKQEMAKAIARNLSENQSELSDEDFERDKETIEYSEKVRKSSPKKTEHSDETHFGSSHNHKKKSRAGKYVAIICTVLIVSVLGAVTAIYLKGIQIYKGVFLDNTYINDVNVSGKTEEEACTLLEEKSVIPNEIKVEKIDGTEIKIPVKELGYIKDTKAVVGQFYSQQNHYAWFSSKFNDTKFTFDAQFKYDKDKLEKALDTKLLKNDSGKNPVDAYISEDDEGSGYVVVSEKSGTKIDTSKKKALYKFIEQQIDDKKYTIDISQQDCYRKPKVTADKLQPVCDKLNNLADMEITFDFTYTTETLGGDKIKEWVTLDEDSQNYTVDEDKAMKYVESLAKKYDTYGKTRKFKTTKRGTINIPKGEGCYGWWIDQQKTCDLIVDLIEKGKSIKTEPVYYVNPDSQYSYTCNKDWRTADTDYSDTYIEVDLTAQHLWYYEKGKLKMESDIVSGYISESRHTPPGVYKLWYKEQGKTLRGSSDGVSYASYVEYWNYISTIGIGLHDASWQNGVFGGTKYKTSTWGSHGCINMPFDKAQFVYNNIPLDTPVFIYQ